METKDILKRLTIAYENLETVDRVLVDGLNIFYNSCNKELSNNGYRCLGALEAGLVISGFLGCKIPYCDVEIVNFWGKKKIRKEYYSEVILRLSEEYLVGKKILKKENSL